MQVSKRSLMLVVAMATALGFPRTDALFASPHHETPSKTGRPTWMQYGHGASAYVGVAPWPGPDSAAIVRDLRDLIAFEDPNAPMMHPASAVTGGVGMSVVVRQVAWHKSRAKIVSVAGRSGISG